MTNTATPNTTEKKRNIRYVNATKAIRLHCLSCVCESALEVDICPCPDCVLWPYRYGKRPQTAAKQGYIVDPALYDETILLKTRQARRAKSKKDE